MKKIAILGSTGSIGTQTLDIVREQGDIQVVAMAAGSNISLLEAQMREFKPSLVSVWDEKKASELRTNTKDLGIKIVSGMEGLLEVSVIPESEILVTAIVGMLGIRPTIAAIKAGKKIALANKETLVTAGHIIIPLAKEYKVPILPVDSEHNAIFQCLNGNHGGPEAVSRLILTASGGPFRTWNREDLEHVTLEQALKHPTWSMGRKITIDSATLFNKGLEMIEARWLFDVPMEKVDVIVHPQSIVHSMVEYRDGTVLAQMSSSDMCFPIQYAVTWPDRVPNSLKQLNFAEIGRLVFEAPRTDVFPALDLARRAGNGNSTLAAVYNATNEAAVNAFIHGQISFPGIWKLVEAVMDDHTPADPRGELAPILEADQWARRRAAELLPSFSRPC